MKTSCAFSSKIIWVYSIKNDIIITNNKKTLNQVFPIRKTSECKIRKSGSTKLYDITTFKKQFSFKRISVSAQKHNKYLWFFKMPKVTDSDTESDSSDIESLLSCTNASKLVLYLFQPFASSNDEDSDSEGNAQRQWSSNSQIGNTEWCKCNNCWHTETDAESSCCAEGDEIHKEMFEGKLTLCVLLISHSTMPRSFKIYISINSVFV